MSHVFDMDRAFGTLGNPFVIFPRIEFWAITGRAFSTLN